jgi:hypothetical protein
MKFEWHPKQWLEKPLPHGLIRLIGAALWIYLGWDLFAYANDLVSFPAHLLNLIIVIPLGFYAVAGFILILKG